jgi:hypothetical protein
VYPGGITLFCGEGYGAMRQAYPFIGRAEPYLEHGLRLQRQ